MQQQESVSEFSVEMPREARRYKKISTKERLRLIQQVLQKGRTIKSAAKKLRISPSTARVIVRKFQGEGVVFQAKSMKQLNMVQTKKSEKFLKIQSKQEKLAAEKALPIAQEQIMVYFMPSQCFPMAQAYFPQFFNTYNFPNS